ITTLQKRCDWRDIAVEIIPINQATPMMTLNKIDLLFGGGAQDHEQELVIKDLQKKKSAITTLIEKDTPALFVCGAPQLMGNYYEPAVGTRIEGLGIFDMVSKHPGSDQPRLIGNLVAEVTAPAIQTTQLLVGFENHGGRTYLGEKALPFAKVIKGFGNNGEDGTEGVVYKNAIGCYLHGPLLPKNPEIADHLIKTALEVKYKKKITLKQLDDALEKKANEAILKKLDVSHIAK
ncbi:MAG TPA: cobalamin biosynthesis protein CobQ, partial [Patescibacteria group bacterium]|nr:cobalamin biosynthesis protein CobQ [Patescibacteria group bacterium]